MRRHSSQIDPSKIAIRIARGDRRQDFELTRAAAAALLGLLPLTVVLLLGLGGYALFRDEMLASLMRRQAQTQFAYEDRIAALRSQIDALASRQMLNQDSFEGKVAELAVRQSRIESRSALLASLAAKVDFDGADSGSTSVRRSAATAAAPVTAPARPAQKGANSLATRPAPAKPTPDGFDLRRTQPLDGQGEDVSDASDTSAPERLRGLAERFDRTERTQAAALDALRGPVARKAERLREAFSEAGLPVERMISHAAALHPGKTPLAVGGPFEPAEGAGDFSRAYSGLRKSLAVVEGLQQALPFAPLRAPLSGPLEMTSSFGYRTDPFLGRPALHSGMDFRGDYGEPIRATAAGRVTIAGPSGGYGNMVEVDHGAGLATRYGHMSQIDVEEGQWVAAGTILGQVGSTGRSTGNHLHYEVRVDGAAVDPSRYLKAGRLLNAGL